ncbi:MAG: hypothetical protein GXO62_07275 [Epsilonproteobacteria bacterium]|nr:hypothetical protein [Campylobacterota bacterium]
MKEVFKLTFLTITDIKKFLAIIVVMSLLTIAEPFPFIGYASLIFEKILYLSIGAFLVYLLKKAQNPDEYYQFLQKNSISTMFLHFFPTGAGIMVGSLVIMGFWFILLISILEVTNSIFILQNPHEMLKAISSTEILAQVLIGLYFLYALLYSYVFLGKLGEALGKQSFKAAFVTMILSLVDFKYWLKTFNFKYFVIYSIWSVIILTIYTLMAIGYIFIIFPAIVSNPNSSLIAIPLLNAVTAILTIFTFFSAYKAHKSTL